MEIVRLPKVNDARAQSGDDRAIVGVHPLIPQMGVAFSVPAPSLQPLIEPETGRGSARARAVILRHGVYRLGLALLLATIAVAARAAGVQNIPAGNFAAVLGYVVLIATSLLIAGRRGVATLSVVMTVAADLLLVFGITFLVVPPHYYDRSLLLAGGVIVLTEFHFGRTLAWGALGGTMLAYVLIVAHAIGAGAPLTFPQELWSLAVFVGVSAYFIVQYGSFRHRLRTIVSLFARAEEGDFSGTYDADRDTRNDSVTMVGRAYNQMRAQLASMVLTDPLSGCLNRRGLEQQMAHEIARVVRSGREIALIVLDVDYFKRVNDTFGHLAGDGVIREVAGILKDAVRGADVVSRLGGDEFAVLLPDTNAAGAFRLAKRILESVARHQFHGVAGRVPITVSIGIVADQVPDEDIARDLLSRADEALYAAKDGGRNRVSIWTPNLRAIAIERAATQVR